MPWRDRLRGGLRCSPSEPARRPEAWRRTGKPGARPGIGSLDWSLDCNEGSASTHQVGADLNGLAQLGLGLCAVVQSEISEACEVVRVGHAGAGRLRPESSATTSTAGRRRLLDRSLTGFHKTGKDCFGLIALPQFHESQRPAVLLGAAARRAALTSAASACGLGRRLRPAPRFNGLLAIAQA